MNNLINRDGAVEGKTSAVMVDVEAQIQDENHAIFKKAKSRVTLKVRKMTILFTSFITHVCGVEVLDSG